MATAFQPNAFQSDAFQIDVALSLAASLADATADMVIVGAQVPAFLLVEKTLDGAVSGTSFLARPTATVAATLGNALASVSFVSSRNVASSPTVPAGLSAAFESRRLLSASSALDAAGASAVIAAPRRLSASVTLAQATPGLPLPASGFQADAFQSDAFQINAQSPLGSGPPSFAVRARLLPVATLDANAGIAAFASPRRLAAAPILETVLPGLIASAFQPDAFQANAFEIDVYLPSGIVFETVDIASVAVPADPVTGDVFLFARNRLRPADRAAMFIAGL